MREYKISKYSSDRINLIRLISIFLIIFIHMSSTDISVGETTLSDIPEWLEFIEFIVAQVFARGAVPVFFMISGVLLYRKSFSWKENMKKKCRSLLCPYIIWNTIWILLFAIFQSVPELSDYFGNPDNQIRNFTTLQWIDAYLAIYSRTKPLLYPLWFLKDLFVLNIFSGIILWLSEKLDKAFLLICFLLCLAGLSPLNFDMQSLFWFVCGLYIVKYQISFDRIDKLPLGKTVCIYIITAVILTVASIHGGASNVVTILMNAFSAIMIMRISSKLMGLLNLKFIRLASGETFFVFLFHEWNLLIARKILIKLLPQYPIIQLMEFFLLPTLMICIAVLTAYLLKTIFPSLYFILVGRKTSVSNI